MTAEEALGFDCGVAIGQLLAKYPDLSPADAGERVARALASAFDADAATTARVVDTARIGFATIDRSVYLAMAADVVNDQTDTGTPTSPHGDALPVPAWPSSQLREAPGDD